MIYLTILNTIAIAYLFYKKGKFYIDWRKDTTFINNTVVAYHITLWKKTSEFSASRVYTLVIPIKNKKKVEKEEEIIGAVGIEDSIYDDEVEDLEEAAKRKSSFTGLKGDVDR